MPLGLLSDDRPDVALVTELQQSRKYLAYTFLPLQWAYQNARLICRPDSDWLDPELISEESLEEEGEEIDEGLIEDAEELAEPVKEEVESDDETREASDEAR